MIERTCEACGKAFRTIQSRINKGGGRFCSLGCRRRPRRPVDERFWVKVDKSAGPDECWPWLAGSCSAGYGTFRFNDRENSSNRVAWMLSFGPIPDGLWVLHRCDNPPCCNPRHLFLGTCGDNVRDCIAKGRGNRARGERSARYTHPETTARGERNGTHTHPERIARGNKSGARLHPETHARGERQGSAKLTESDIRTIRQMRSDGLFLREIARQFGIGTSQVRRIAERESWHHVP